MYAWLVVYAEKKWLHCMRLPLITLAEAANMGPTTVLNDDLGVVGCVALTVVCSLVVSLSHVNCNVKILL